MYAIKMDSSKNLNTTIKSTIYQNEHNADTLVFLIPKYYGNTNIADGTVLLRYILPDNIGYSEELEMDPEPYNNDYYRYNLKITTLLTKNVGNIELWLSVVDMYDNVVLKTGSTTIYITKSKDITEYMSNEDLNQLDKLDAKVTQLEISKADDIVLHKTDNTIQLTAQGANIGRRIDMAKLVEDVDNDDVIEFNETNDEPDEPENPAPIDDVIKF